MVKAAFLKGIKNIEVGDVEVNSYTGIKLRVDSCALCGSDKEYLIVVVTELNIQL